MTSELTIRVREFGELTMTVDGLPVKPRIAKSVELLAYLASAPAPEATRDDLMTILFEGRDDDSARSYLRQVVHRLREVLPADTGPAFSGRTLRFTAPVALVSESVALRTTPLSGGSAARCGAGERHCRCARDRGPWRIPPGGGLGVGPGATYAA